MRSPLFSFLPSSSSRRSFLASWSRSSAVAALFSSAAIAATLAVAPAALMASCGGEVSVGERPVDGGAPPSEAGALPSVPQGPDGGPDGAATALDACGWSGSATNLHVCAATLLGGPGADRGRAADIMADGTIVVAGAIAGNDFGVTPTALLRGGDGVVMRLDPLGRKVLSVTRIGTEVSDVAVDPLTNRIGVVGDFGMAVLDPTATSVIWRRGIARAEHVAFGATGALATTHEATLTIDPPGSMGASPITVTTAASIADVVIDDSVDSGGGQAIVIGTIGDRSGPCGSRYESLYLASYRTSDGAPRWSSYGWTSAQASAADACEPTQGTTLAVGLNGAIAIAASAANPKNVLEHGSLDLSKTFAVGGARDPYASLTDPNGVNSAFIGYVESKTGNTILGTWLTGRENADGTGRVAGATVWGMGMDVNDGLYVAGQVFGYMANRSQLAIEGTPVGTWFGGDGFVAAFGATDLDRQLWTTWTKTGEATFMSIAFSDGLAVAVGTTTPIGSTGELITVHPIQATRAGDTDAFLTVFPFTVMPPFK